MIRVGLLGGSFDPVHVAHLAMAQHALGPGGLHRVIFMPARVPPHKLDRDLAPGADRMEMLRLATAEQERTTVSDLELRREGPSYTLTTVRMLKDELSEDAELHLLLGSDSVRDLPSWWHAEELVQEVRVLAYERKGVPLPLPGRLLAEFGPEASRRCSTGEIPERLRGISATEIRRRLRAGEAIAGLVPEAVRAYILTRGLYAGD